MTENHSISIIVPVLNEEGSLDKLYSESIPIMKYNQKHLCNFDVEDMVFNIFNQLVK